MNGQINLTIEDESILAFTSFNYLDIYYGHVLQAKVFAAVLLKFLRESGGISVDEVSKMDLTPLTA